VRGSFDNLALAFEAKDIEGDGGAVRSAVALRIPSAKIDAGLSSTSAASPTHPQSASILRTR